MLVRRHLPYCPNLLIFDVLNPVHPTTLFRVMRRRLLQAGRQRRLEAGFIFAQRRGYRKRTRLGFNFGECGSVLPECGGHSISHVLLTMAWAFLQVAFKGPGVDRLTIALHD